MRTVPNKIIKTKHLQLQVFWYSYECCNVSWGKITFRSIYEPGLYYYHSLKNIQFCQLLQDHILNLWRRRWCNFQRFIYLVFQNATWAYPNFPHEIWHIIKNQTITTIFDTNVWTVYWDYGSNIYLLALMIYFKHTSMDAILNYFMHPYFDRITSQCISFSYFI